MGHDTFTFLSRNKTRDIPWITFGEKEKCVCLSVSAVIRLLLVVIFCANGIQRHADTSPDSKQSLVLLAEEGLAQYQGASLGIYDPVEFR